MKDLISDGCTWFVRLLLIMAVIVYPVFGFFYALFPLACIWGAMCFRGFIEELSTKELQDAKRRRVHNNRPSSVSNHRDLASQLVVRRSES